MTYDPYLLISCVVSGNTMILAFNLAIVGGAFTSYSLDVLIGPHPDVDTCVTASHVGGNMTSRMNISLQLME